MLVSSKRTRDYPASVLEEWTAELRSCSTLGGWASLAHQASPKGLAQYKGDTLGVDKLWWGREDN